MVNRVQQKENPIEKIKGIDGVEFVFPTITEDVLFKNSSKQQIGQIKGVPNEYNEIKRVRGTILNDSIFTVSSKDLNFGIPGVGIAYFLGINIYQPYSSVQVYIPKRGNASSFSLENSFSSSSLVVRKIFSTQQEVDERLVLAPFDWLSELMEYQGLATDVEIFIKNQESIVNKDLKRIKKEIKNILGD